MAYSRPTLSELQNRVVSDVEGSIEQTTPILRFSIFRVLGRVFAGAIHGLYGFGQWIAKQITPDTAESDRLEGWCRVWGISRKAAEYAAGNVTMTGTNGVTIPAGTILIGNNQIEYQTDSDVTISSGTATALVTALTSGTTGNLAASDTMTFSEPIAGADSTATIASGGITGGIDEESDDDLRARLLSRIQQPPHGGAVFDYVSWALEVPGVTRAWAYENYTAIDKVGVTFVCDDTEGGPIPTAEKVTEVYNYIDARRPATAKLTVFAPTEKVINFTIALTPNTAAVKAAVQTELEAMILEKAYPGQTLTISQIDEVISGAAGETSHIMSVPAVDVAINLNEFGSMGAITWL